MSLEIRSKDNVKFNLKEEGHEAIVICQRTARQRLDKHPAIHARNNRTNVYSSLLGNSQRANELPG
jgi:hypothetical protein